MKILFLHGWQSVPGGVKPTFLSKAGHIVINPQLPDDDFAAAVKIAQSEYDLHSPDVVVGSSRGGAVAMNLSRPDARLVLLCPAWKKWGDARTVPANTTIIHSRADDVVPFEFSFELANNSGLRAESLVEIGTDHRLADPQSLAAMLRACEQPIPRPSMNEQEKPLLKTPGKGKVVGVVGDTYRLMATGKETNGRYSQIDATVPPGGGPPPHIHHREAESFYVVEGEMSFWVDGEKSVVHAGSFAHMPIGSLHAFRNESKTPTRMIITIIPAGLEEMFIEVGRDLPEGATQSSPPTHEEIEKLMSTAPRYGVEIRLPDRG